MAQSNLRAPQCEAFVFGRAARLLQQRESAHHRHDRPGRHADEDEKAKCFRHVIAFHFGAEEFAAEIAERRRYRRGREIQRALCRPEFAARRMVLAVGNRTLQGKSRLCVFATMGSGLSRYLGVRFHKVVRQFSSTAKKGYAAACVPRSGICWEVPRRTSAFGDFAGDTF